MRLRFDRGRVTADSAPTLRLGFPAGAGAGAGERKKGIAKYRPPLARATETGTHAATQERCHSERSEESAFVLSIPRSAKLPNRPQSGSVSVANDLRYPKNAVILSAAKDLRLLLGSPKAALLQSRPPLAQNEHISHNVGRNHWYTPSSVCD